MGSQAEGSAGVLGASLNPEGLVPAPRAAGDDVLVAEPAEAPVTKADAVAAVQQHVGDVGEVLDVDAMDCEVWAGGGAGSEKRGRQVGGKMLVLYDVAGNEGVMRRRIEIDDDHRELPEDIITFFGVAAQAKRAKGEYIVSHVRG